MTGFQLAGEGLAQQSERPDGRSQLVADVGHEVSAHSFELAPLRDVIDQDDGAEPLAFGPQWNGGDDQRLGRRTMVVEAAGAALIASAGGDRGIDLGVHEGYQAGLLPPVVVAEQRLGLLVEDGDRIRKGLDGELEAGGVAHRPAAGPDGPALGFPSFGQPALQIPLAHSSQSSPASVQRGRIVWAKVTPTSVLSVTWGWRVDG